MTGQYSLYRMLDMNLNLDAMRKEVGEIMDARGLSLRDLATTLDTLPSHNTLANFLDGASSSPELVADLAKWMGKSLREFETWHPKPRERSTYLPPLTVLAKLQALLKEARISPKMARLLVDLVQLEAKERMEKSTQAFIAEVKRRPAKEAGQPVQSVGFKVHEEPNYEAQAEEYEREREFET